MCCADKVSARACVLSLMRLHVHVHVAGVAHRFTPCAACMLCAVQTTCDESIQDMTLGTVSLALNIIGAVGTAGASLAINMANIASDLAGLMDVIVAPVCGHPFSAVRQGCCELLGAAL